MTEVERGIDTPDGAAEEPDEDARSGRSGEDVRDERPGEETPGESSGDEAPGETAAGRGSRRIGVLVGVALLAYALDLATKLIVVAKLEHHAPIQVIGTLLQLDVIRNRGAAFGIGEALTIVLTVIAAAVIVVIARIARKLYSTPWAIALGLLLGGAFGNLTDRIFRAPSVFQGAVVDFIAPSHFAVFNLADSAIVCGGVLIVILSFRGLDPDGTVHRD
ncbi:signal peptidase II [Streptomyces sp. NPDC054796]|uniref:Lipoprotein signal peptidase n=1 Tax=Streptomyces daliensis TaxID=299421 RepID=A0A8T4IIM8_9ACTN|nr:signal peptidase II [Streptomyces daliensis]